MLMLALRVLPPRHCTIQLLEVRLEQAIGYVVHGSDQAQNLRACSMQEEADYCTAVHYLGTGVSGPLHAARAPVLPASTDPAVV